MSACYVVTFMHVAHIIHDYSYELNSNCDGNIESGGNMKGSKTSQTNSSSVSFPVTAEANNWKRNAFSIEISETPDVKSLRNIVLKNCFRFQ